MTVHAVHRFSGRDPWENLAREEVWLADLAPGRSLLVLYVNGPCVVFGKHQNPFREVRVAEAVRRGLPLVRRATGGGTVYHDEGNLNWSWMGPKEAYDRDALMASVAQALAPLGLSLTVGDKGDLYWNGKKVTGSASQVKRDRVLHHGTLLCGARLEDLHGVLGPTGTLGEWVGVASRPAPVVNLGLGVDEAVAALVAAFSEPGLVPGDGTGNADFEARVTDRARELADPRWVWDQTPPFSWEGETRQGFVKVSVREGIVERDDTNQNMSKIVGKRFFDEEMFEYIPTREVL